MMTIVTGAVESITKRPTQFGTMYNVTVNGTTYGAGNLPPQAEVGDYVTFESYKNGAFHNMKTSTLKKAVGTPEPVSSATSTEPVATSVAVTPEPRRASSHVDARQASIVFQSSRKDALELTRILVECEGAGFTKADKWKDKHEKVVTLFEDLTRRLYHQAMDHETFAGKPTPVADTDTTTEEDGDE